MRTKARKARLRMSSLQGDITGEQLRNVEGVMACFTLVRSGELTGVPAAPEAISFPAEATKVTSQVGGLLRKR